MKRMRRHTRQRHARLRLRARRGLVRGVAVRIPPVLDWRALLVHGRLGPHQLAGLQVQQALDWLGSPSHWTQNPFWPMQPTGARALKGSRVDWPVILAWGWLEFYFWESGELFMLHLDSFDERGRPILRLRAVHTSLVRGGKSLASIRRRMQRAGLECSETRDSLNRPVLTTLAGFRLSFDLEDGKQAPGLGAVTWTAEADSGHA